MTLLAFLAGLLIAFVVRGIYDAVRAPSMWGDDETPLLFTLDGDSYTDETDCTATWYGLRCSRRDGHDGDHFGNVIWRKPKTLNERAMRNIENIARGVAEDAAN